MIRRIIDWALHQRLLVILGSVAIFIASIATLGATFFKF